ncbi:MAG TPA: TadE/TadG family type IV pilus assembly protein [Bacillota bacterium]|nr:TadE/TadG family type IV pilus assembly protein [Bacillota bacterium]
MFLRRKPGKRILNDEKGQALVEMALVAPILLLLVFGIVEFGRIFNTYLVVTNAAREGARAAVVGAVDTSIRDTVENAGSILDADRLTITISPDAAYRSRGTPLQVTVTYPVTIYAPVISNIIGSTYSVNGSATMRME